MSSVTCNKHKDFAGFFIYLYSFLIFFSSNLIPASSFPSNDNVVLNSCQKCKIVVDSFKEGLKKTARGKHEGGDAYWEEKKLNNYANSEIRLIEIQENLCQDVTSGKEQCYSFAEEFENEIENWFFKHRENENSEDNLLDYLCNQVARVCCPEGHFGKNCSPCYGYPNNICSNRGYCSGNGTREENGKCLCYLEFQGEYCDKCADNYLASGTIEIFIENKTFALPEKCDPCDTSCQSSCHSLGPKGCHVCREGFLWDENNGCIDINECLSLETDPCKENMYCINTIGSFKCYTCHESCEKCTSSGPDSCVGCKQNYLKIGWKCIKIDLPLIMWLKLFFYIASSISLFFVAQKSFWMATGLALTIGIYIAKTEILSE